MLTRALTLSALLSLATGQVSISSTCQETFINIATSSDVDACLMPKPLITIFTNPNASIVEPIDNWLTGLCAAPACSNTTLAAIIANATNGCSAEFRSVGLSGFLTSAITALVQQYYPTVRKAVCLKDGNTNCVTQTLTNVQNGVGTLSPSNFATLVSSGEIKIPPTNITCTNCIKAIYNTVTADISGFLVSPEDLQETCGNSFTDGKTPANITQSAFDVTQSNNTSSQDSNGATQLSFGTPQLSSSVLSGASIIFVLVLLV